MVRRPAVDLRRHATMGRAQDSEHYGRADQQSGKRIHATTPGLARRQDRLLRLRVAQPDRFRAQSFHIRQVSSFNLS